MRRQLGRSSALVFAFIMLAATGMVLWAADVTTNGATRRTLIGRLKADERSGTPGSLIGRPGESRSSRGKKRASGKAEAAPAPKIADPDSSCTLTGIVSDEERRPVSGVKVSVRGPGSYERSAETDAEGNFTISGIATGTFNVYATSSSFVPLVRPGLTLAHEGQVERIDFQLPLGETLKGLVKDEDGKPLAGVLVAAHRRRTEALEDGGFFIDDATYKTQKTDQDGTFSVAGVSQGGNVFEFSKPGYQGEVKTLDVRPKKEQSKIEVVLRRTGVLEGVVMEPDGTPVSTATVHLVGYKPALGRSEPIEKGKITAVSDAEGRFKFSKLYTEGYYDLLIDDERYALASFGMVPVGSTGVTCTVDDGGQISGSVQFIDRPTTEASVVVLAETVVRGTTFTKEIKSNGAGLFTFDRMPYGKYNLTVRASGLASEPKRDVPCERGKPTRDVVVEVYEASTVKGRVADGRSDSAVPGAVVVLEASYGPNFSRRRTFQSRADQHGGFSFFRVPAGSHVARATAKGFLKNIANRSESRFTLQAGERKADLVLILDRGGMVDGFVLDQHGRPVHEADIQLFAASSVFGGVDTRSLKAKTDRTGYFQISGIEVGERAQLYASARRQGFAKGRSRIIDLTQRSPEATTQIQLHPGGSISGKVMDKRDLPIPGALLRFESSEFPGDPSPSAATAQARPDGTFTIANVTPGQGSVSVSRSGYVRQSRGVSVKETEPTGNVNFKLEPGRRIKGRVVALDGNPIANARVSASGLDGADGSDSAVTDKWGRFILSNLGEGYFKLQATFNLSTSEGEQHYRFENARVPSGLETATIDCDVGNVLTGVVVGQNDAGIPGFTLSLRSKDDTKPAQDFTFNLDRGHPQSKGSFQVFKIPRGLYRMKVSAEGYEPYVEEDLGIGPTQRTDLPRIRLRPAGGVIGALVSSSTNRPVNGVRVTLLDTSKTDAEARRDAPGGTTDASGEFRITTALEGTYNIEFSHPSYLPQKMERVRVTARRVTDLGRLYMEAGGAIRGTVTDEYGDPVRGLHVKVTGTDKETHTDQAGNYLFQGVQAGRWNVVARGRVNNARTVYSYQVAAVQPDETETLDFHLETTADLRGVLRAAADSGTLSSGKVQIHPFDENAVVLEDIHYDATAAASNARFEISQVPPGPYFLWATGIGAANAAYTAWQTLSLQRGRNDTVVQVGGAAVKGTVTQASTGEGAGKVRLQLRPLFDSLRLPQGVYDELILGATTSDTGTYRLNNVQPGAYQLFYKDPEFGWFAQTPFHLLQNQLRDGNDLTLP